MLATVRGFTAFSLRGNNHVSWSIDATTRSEIALAIADSEEPTLQLGRGHQNSKQASSSFGSANPMWKHIWSFPVPPKVKVFWWKVSHDFLPSRAKLRDRHVERIGFCNVCGARDETL